MIKLNKLNVNDVNDSVDYDVVFYNKSLAESVEEYIQEMILKGYYKYGERLIEAKIAEKLNISRGPVRDGIKSLEQKGVVNIEPRKGARVAKFLERDFWEILELRLLLENSIIESLIEEKTLNYKDFNYLRQLVDEMMLIEKSDKEHKEKILSINKLNMAFHQYIWGKSNSKRRKNILNSMIFQLRLAMLYDFNKSTDLKHSIELHYTLLEYIESGEIRKAKRILKAHIVSINK